MEVNCQLPVPVILTGGNHSLVPNQEEAVWAPGTICVLENRTASCA
jgi:hypothetical protein